MKITAKMIMNLKTKEVTDKVNDATRKSLVRTVVAIQNDAIKNAKAVKAWKTGHNARSIVSEVSGMGIVKQGEDAQPQRVVDDGKLEGAVYSTSGYGGYLETGTYKMAARPYFKPALDKNIHKLPQGIKAELR